MNEQPVETTLYSLDDSAPSAPDRRSGERHLSLFRVGALTIGDRRELCLIRNVSAGGMLIRAYCAIEPGERITIELKQGEPIHGTARWAKDECVGVTGSHLTGKRTVCGAPDVGACVIGCHGT